MKHRSRTGAFILILIAIGVWLLGRPRKDKDES